MMAGSATDEQECGSIAATGSSGVVQYIHLGALPDDDEGVTCYEAVFEGGRIHIPSHGIDLPSARRHLAEARSEQARLHIVVGRPIGLDAGGATRVAVGYAEPLFAYTIDDVELLGQVECGKALPDAMPGSAIPPDVRIIA
ncbi:hypothetical protein EDC65_0285 [Stella humosa]|uniref:Uncharacterized protein n=1 Tax=Stella humosa TaxID=94 RepID=A0A3N1MCT8_9PROT|nr:hypothetical protein [Stella humosa]ROQ01109.1 hypothetical protein EDC65_0285 [Stella humosa]BBK31481.1 hypothetical protein STHU_21150 [Stella humosa]